jgi:hypothetical protein
MRNLFLALILIPFANIVTAQTVKKDSISTRISLYDLPPNRVEPINGESFVNSSNGNYVRYDKYKNQIESCTQQDLVFTCYDPDNKVIKRFKVDRLR